jgi:hypothetical protein
MTINPEMVFRRSFGGSSGLEHICIWFGPENDARARVCDYDLDELM